jgi:glutamine synthetase
MNAQAFPAADLPAEPGPGRTAAVAKYLAALGADTVECCYPDLLGALVGRTMTVPRFLETLDTGFSMPEATLAWNVVGDIKPVEYTSAATGFPNMRAVPDTTTLRRSAWADRTALCLCDTRAASGNATPLDSRQILRTASDGLRALGVSVTVATEVEFYLCTADRAPLAGLHKCFSLEIAGEVETVLADIRSTLASSAVEVESTQTEYGPGQFEINTFPGPPLAVADSAAILKYLVKRIARRHGLRATFMAKPFGTGSSSGLHIHQAVADDSERPSQPLYGLPATTAHYLAGLLAHLPELTAMSMPTVTAYKRTADYTMAPNRAVWGVDNRTALIRSIPGRPIRLESRLGSADANPYHVVAACLAAGAQGITGRMNPPPPTPGDAYQLVEAPRLPRTLADAATRLHQSEFARKSFGDVFVNVLSTVCQQETELFQASVTDWERDRYFDLA